MNSKILADRLEQVEDELISYVQAFEKSTNFQKEGKEMLSTMSEEEVLEKAYEVFSAKQLYSMDIHTLEMTFRITYENLVLVDPEYKISEETKNIYKGIKTKQLKPFYIVGKDKEFKALDETKIESIKENFKNNLKESNTIEYILQQIEKNIG